MGGAQFGHVRLYWYGAQYIYYIYDLLFSLPLEPLDTCIYILVLYDASLLQYIKHFACCFFNIYGMCPISRVSIIYWRSQHVTLQQNQFTLRVGEAHSNSPRTLAHGTLYSLRQRGGNRGFIYIFWVLAKPWPFIAAPADSITANGNLVGLVPSH